MFEARSKSRPSSKWTKLPAGWSGCSGGTATSDTEDTRGTLKQPAGAPTNDASIPVVRKAGAEYSLHLSNPGVWGTDVKGNECCLGGSAYWGRPWAVMVAQEEAGEPEESHEVRGVADGPPEVRGVRPDESGACPGIGADANWAWKKGSAR